MKIYNFFGRKNHKMNIFQFSTLQILHFWPWIFSNFFFYFCISAQRNCEFFYSFFGIKFFILRTYLPKNSKIIFPILFQGHLDVALHSDGPRGGGPAHPAGYFTKLIFIYFYFCFIFIDIFQLSACCVRWSWSAEFQVKKFFCDF